MATRRLYIALALLTATALLLSGCGKSAPTSPQRNPTGAIYIGKETAIAAGSVSSSGGSVIVTDKSSPIAGLEITVPPNSYSAATQFKVSYAPVKKHTFGEDFNPVTPLITVDNGGQYSEDPMEVKIPVKLPDGQFAMAFLLDKERGELEGLPIIAQDAESITIATRHFSNIIVGGIDRARLQGDIDSGFKPGIDDWQFTNRGSFLAPGGHCAGQSLTAMWYYFARPDGDGTHLFGKYDNNGNDPATPDFWRDDSLGYRFSSVVQEDADWDGAAYTFFIDKAKEDPQKTWDAFRYSMKLPGKRPQLVAIFNTANHTGHALVAYKISGNKIFVADPNYPGRTDRFIEFVDGKFKPYNSGANAEEIAAGNGKEYDLIAYAGMSATVDWKQISRRWEEVKAATIGNNRFPSYQIDWMDEQGNWQKLEDGFKSPQKLLKLGITAKSGISGANIRFYAYRDGADRAATPDQRFDGGMAFELKPGKNVFGILVNGVKNQKEKYIDFRYFTVDYKDDGKEWKLIETVIDPPSGKRIDGFGMSFEGTVKDGQITRKAFWDIKNLTQSGGQYFTSFLGQKTAVIDPSFAVTTVFDFSKPPPSVKPGASITLKATATHGYTGTTTVNATTSLEYIIGYWSPVEGNPKAFNVTGARESGFGVAGGNMTMNLVAQPGGKPITTSSVLNIVMPQAQGKDIAIQVRNFLGFQDVTVTWIYRLK